MYNCILTRASWNVLVIVTKQAKIELQLLRENGRVYNNDCRSIEHNTFAEISMFTDASFKGYGGYLENLLEALEVGNIRSLVVGEDQSLEVG